VETRHHSLIHWTAWPAMGRCALQTSRSPAMPKQHLQWARHRSPAGGSRFVGDDLVDVSTPVGHQVGDRHGSWQPDEVLHVLVLILADDVHDRILRFACFGFCCRCFVAGSGSLLTRLAQSRISQYSTIQFNMLSMSMSKVNLYSAFSSSKLLMR